MLINPLGSRLNDARLKIVQDKRRTRDGFAVLNGISCMRCHVAGTRRNEAMSGSAQRKSQCLLERGLRARFGALRRAGETPLGF